MELKKQFVMRPFEVNQAQQNVPIPDDVSSPPDKLGPLQDLIGEWEGLGFNTIWRPTPTAPQHFLELNLTSETLKFEEVPGEIPNRGLLQPDIIMFGIHYLQQIKDVNTGSGLHFEPGIFLNVPATTHPKVPATICRMASIPHGTTVLAQGLTLPAIDGAPKIDLHGTDITPFPIGSAIKDNGIVQNPSVLLTETFAPEMTLSDVNINRSNGINIQNITQQMVSFPNSVLIEALKGQEVLETTTMVMSSDHKVPVTGGGVTNIAFLEGENFPPGKDPKKPQKPNADASKVFATFWIEKVKGDDGKIFMQLQYSQTVFLDFNGLTWPHVTVATLRKKEKVEKEKGAAQKA